MFKIALKIALKFLVYKIDGLLSFVRKTFLLATIGLTLSVVSLIVLNSVSNGYKHSLKDKLSQIESHIRIGKYNNQKILDDELKDLTLILKKLENIDKYLYESEEKAILKDKEYSEGVIVKTLVGDASGYLGHFSTGGKLDIKEKKAAIGRGLKEHNSLAIDSSIILLNTDFQNSGIVYNKALSLKITNQLNFGIPEMDNFLIYIDNKDFEKLFGHNSITNVRIFLKDSERQLEVSKLLESQLRDDFYVTTFDDSHKKRLDNLNDIFNSISIIFYFLIAVCFLNISSSIWLVIESKNKDIKILKLTGMSDFYIYIIFFLIISFSILLSFLIGISFSYLLICIQNNFQVFSISSDVYMVSELIGIVEIQFLLKLLMGLQLTSIVVSLVPYLKKKIFKNKIIENV